MVGLEQPMSETEAAFAVYARMRACRLSASTLIARRLALVAGCFIATLSPVFAEVTLTGSGRGPCVIEMNGEVLAEDRRDVLHIVEDLTLDDHRVVHFGPIPQPTRVGESQNVEFASKFEQLAMSEDAPTTFDYVLGAVPVGGLSLGLAR